MRYPEEIIRLEEMADKLTKIRDELSSMKEYCVLHSSYGTKPSKFPYISKALNDMTGDIIPDINYIEKSIALLESKIKYCKKEFNDDCDRIRPYILEEKESDMAKVNE